MRQANNSFLFYASGRRFCSELRANLELRRRQDIFAQVSAATNMTVPSRMLHAARLQQLAWAQQPPRPAHITSHRPCMPAQRRPWFRPISPKLARHALGMTVVP
jgi:Protein of unknown function (DUF1682)